MRHAASPADYAALRRLRRLVFRATDAPLIFLWASSGQLDWIFDNLDSGLRARSRRIWRFRLARDDGAAASAFLTQALAPPPGDDHNLVWLDVEASGSPLVPAPGLPAVLARLNERRAQVMAPPRALVLASPLNLEALVARVAPDLWSVRSLSMALEWSPSAAEPAGPSEPARAAVDAELGAHGPLFRRWQAAWEAGQSGGLASRLNLELGLLAAQDALRRRDLDTARTVLDQLDIAQAGRADDLPTQFARGWMLQLMGDLHWQAGELHRARERYEQSLGVREKLVRLTGESPQALRDWSVSLNKVGDALRAQGELGAARERYEQSLSLREKLVRLTGESPEALRDWSVSLDNVGDALHAQGELGAARERYEQSLGLSEKLVRLTGESPQALRDWSVSLDKVGDALHAQGELGAARERYEQSLGLRERLVRLTGESPQALRDWLVAVANLRQVAPELARLRAQVPWLETALAQARQRPEDAGLVRAVVDNPSSTPPGVGPEPASMP